jgi:hypothetical protein
MSIFPLFLVVPVAAVNNLDSLSVPYVFNLWAWADSIYYVLITVGWDWGGSLIFSFLKISLSLNFSNCLNYPLNYVSFAFFI